MMDEEKLDPQRQQKAKQLARISRRLMVIELVLGFIYLLAWLNFGWSIALKGALLNVTTNQWVLVIGFAAIFGGIYALISLPFLYYEDYVLPHRFGLSTQSFGMWVIDQIKGTILVVILGGVMLEIMYAILRVAPNTWWLWVGAILLLLNVILANLAPVLIMPIFYKFQPLGDEYTELVARLMVLSNEANTYVRGVYKFDMSHKTTAANAALTGLGRTRRIILGDTLLENFSIDEIETVLAHELAHHVYKDIPVGIIIESLVTLIGLYLASLGLKWGVVTLGYENVADIAAMPLLVLILGLYGMIIMPIENAYSRWREQRADRFALQITGNGDAYASALTKLANQNLSDVDPEPWVEVIFYSHPALGKRIEMAKTFATAQVDLNRICARARICCLQAILTATNIPSPAG